MTLQQGSSGDLVRQLQTALHDAGFGPDTIDGDFGAATKAAVIAFQESKDLPADGIAGPNTLAALGLNFPESQPAVASDTDLTSTLFVDYYQFDNGRIPDLTAVSADGRYAGAIVKATEGLYYNGGNWFSQQWPSIHDQNGYGDTWLRGCYHFLKFNQDGGAQADFYLKTIEAAGGWDTKGDLWPIVDVELGSEGNPAKNIKRNSNQDASAQQIIDCTTAFAERCASETGRKVMLYGNGAMRDKSINDRMSCDWMWCPRYTPDLPSKIYERAGWSRDQLVLWQYAGDGTGFLAGYPTATPDDKKCDHSCLVLSGGLSQLISSL